MLNKQWLWLTEKTEAFNWAFVLRVVVKAALLFALLNLAFALLAPLPTIGRLSLYNGPLPGRLRLPYGENPARAYSLSPMSLDAMFSTHRVDTPKPPDEYRVLVIGDSATWGFLLEPDQTMTAHLNAAGHTLGGGDGREVRAVRAYNLGYPIMSLTKDLMLLDYALRYQPDMVVWPVTLESFPREKQLFPPLVQDNPGAVRPLIAAYGLDLDPDDPRFVSRDLLGRTIVGRRRALADMLRLQLYGVAWAATGIDQAYGDYEPTARDFEDEGVRDFEGMEAGPLTEEQLALDVLRAGAAMAADAGVPLLLVNEPIFIADGQNSDLRYNAFYPRWAYDDYRAQLAALAEAEGWPLLDLWDLVPPDAFTDSPVHMTPAGAQLVGQALGEAVVSLAE